MILASKTALQATSYVRAQKHVEGCGWYLLGRCHGSRRDTRVRVSAANNFMQMLGLFIDAWIGSR